MNKTDTLPNPSPTPAARGLRPRWWVAAIATLLVTAACGSDAQPGDGTMTTAATVAPAPARFTVAVSDPSLGDLVSQVAGAQVEVVTVVSMGADGHTYQPVPSDARALAEADIYIENGMGLNTVVSAFAASNYPSGTPHFMLSDVIPFEEVITTDTPDQIAAHGHAHSYNAHFWPDPHYAMLYVEEIRRILTEVDPSDADGYEFRAVAYKILLSRMDTAFRTALATIPVANRMLVVYHDSWSYFGRRYGIPVIGVIQPVDFSEPSAAEVREMIDEVLAAGVPAFFGSEVFPSSVLETIEAATGARYVADLSDDKFPGAPGSPEHSYIGMMVANTRTIVTALGGDPTALDSIPLATP